MIDIMRTVHGAYAPNTERFGARLETFFIGLCVAMGDIEGKPLSVAKITGYMGVPRTTVIRRQRSKSPFQCLALAPLCLCMGPYSEAAHQAMLPPCPVC